MENNIRWLYRPKPDRHLVKKIAKEINVSEALGYLLVQRGITSFKEAKLFFRPALEDLHDPFLMQDMAAAVERLQDAIKMGEKVLVYGDYDVDGTTSVAMMYLFLKKHYQKVAYYVPDRYKEGYGISKKGIDYAKSKGYTLMIALDCGIKSVDLVAYAKRQGIDFIICDHHRPGSTLPQAVAVLDPKREDCPYPYKELSGCGVGFKLIQAYCQVEDIAMEEALHYLDLVTVSIGCDIVPITGENRVLAYYGLKKLNTDPTVGLKALLHIAGFKEDKELTIMNVVFGLGPRINAAGRIDHAHSAVKLLVCEDVKEAERYAQIVHEYNSSRKDLDRDITAQALEMIHLQQKQAAKTTVLYKEDWHKGVIGIVASRCIETYHRPTIILTKSGKQAAGSARSVEGVDVYDAIEACADLLEQFGGHMHAAGLTLKIENIPLFQQKFEEVVAQSIRAEQLLPQLDIDVKIRLKDATHKFYRIISQLAPFGPANTQPLFVSENVYCAKPPKLVGKDNPIHLKLAIRQEDSATYDAIGFSLGHFYEPLQAGRRFHICYHLEENHFLGKTTLQLRIKDIRLA
ncbi:MAG: single-stranded-DNA-specific exonuclease RecJ [Thermonemataceae bacterium]